MISGRSGCVGRGPGGRKTREMWVFDGFGGIPVDIATSPFLRLRMLNPWYPGIFQLIFLGLSQFLWGIGFRGVLDALGGVLGVGKRAK